MIRKKYGSDFYKAENIIGYTGDINGKPSVYFQEGDAIGHITQDHNEKINIGREPIISGPGLRNANDGEGGVLQEYVNDELYHFSRNPLIKTSDKADLDKLAKAIKKFPKIKWKDIRIQKQAKELAKKGITHSDAYNNAMINYEKQKLMQQFMKPQASLSEGAKANASKKKKKKESKIKKSRFSFFKR